MGPYLTAAWLNSRLWTRKSPRPVEVADGVWLGRVPASGLPPSLRGVVDTCAELSCRVPGVDYAGVPMLDMVAPPAAALRRAAAAIEAGRTRGAVLACCALGYSRSAASVATLLLASGRAGSVGKAVEIVRAARPAIVLGDAHLAAIASAADGAR